MISWWMTYKLKFPVLLLVWVGKVDGCGLGEFKFEIKSNTDQREREFGNI